MSRSTCAESRADATYGSVTLHPVRAKSQTPSSITLSQIRTVGAVVNHMVVQVESDVPDALDLTLTELPPSVTTRLVA
jgi:hypothetical protein